jgi:protein-S-isoprenylcysteine O-methyltransferase Ste14
VQVSDLGQRILKRETDVHKQQLLQPGWPIIASVVIWCLVSIYWEIAAKTRSEASSQESRGSRRVHVVLVSVAQLLLFFRVPGLNGNWLPVSLIAVVAGLAIEAGGFLLAVWARRVLGKHWSGEITIKVDHELVRTGPYRYVRHPIYTALLLMYLGAAIVSGEWHALLGFVLAVIAYWRKIRLEEANLRRAFPNDYEEYCRQTRALAPGIF